MANLVRNFIKGRMNKSVDERLVPQGEYIDARNIRMGSTEDSEIGAVENTKGNSRLTSLVYPPTGTALSDNATCLGAYSDGANETMYWFVHDPSFTEGATGKLDLIVSYNMRSDLLTYHVVSIEDASDPTNSDTTLNFDPQYLITGIDLVDGLLFFTDDFNPPRRINVATAYPEPVAFVDSGVLGNDILVIKRPPLEAPVVAPVAVVSRENYMEDRLLCFGYRWEYANNEYSATSMFSAPVFESEPFAFTTESYLNEGMVNSVQVCDVTVRTGDSLVKGIDILFKEMDDNIIRVIEKVDKANSALTDNSDYTIQFSKQKIFTILPESEILRLYDNVPRLAKAQTLMGNRIVYGNYLEGYDMVNSDGLSNKLGYNVSLVRTPLDRPDGVSPATPSAPSLHSNRVYEIGIVYMDEFGRSSTALVAPNNKVEIDCGQSIFQNRIRVTIPSIMSAPSWASRYKFVIKPDSEGYETIYTNQNFEYPTDSGEVYFLLEGENAAKVEEGDRYVVKSDTSGAVTSCTYATVLEKKSFAEGELDDTGAEPIPAIGGTYMKMKPNFTYGLPLNISNIAPGEQSAGTNGNDDQSTENGDGESGTYPRLVYTGFDSNDILTGTRIRLTMSFTRQGRGEALCETRTLDFDHTWEVEADYNDITEWFYGVGTSNTVIDDIQAALGVSGDPAEAAPTNLVYGITTVDPNVTPDFGVNGDPAVNNIFFNVFSGDISFVAFGTNKCPGGLSGSSPNRRSRIKAEWTVTRSTDVVVFETEPQPALPDLWYESSQSFIIDQNNGWHYGNVQDQTGTQPAIIDTAFFNCISFGNGVESYKIRDSVKGKPITLGNRVTTTSDERFAAVRRFADLTYSGVINDETNINKLNEFNLGLLNFKPLEDSYGPVEKLFARRTDILTLQEDKISYVLAGKNLLTDATGESVVTSVPEVLGNQVARVEDFGISNNPESFAEWGPHKFFTDAKRGSVIHLYGDGQKEQLTVISENGMRSWFRDEFITNFNTQKLGGYDPYMNEYVLASNDTFLPGQEDCIECNTIQTFLLTPAQQSFCVNLGNITGDVTINYNIIEATDGDEATISTTYPDDPTSTPVVTGPISNASQPSVPSVNKNSIVDNTVGIDLNYTGTERFVLQVQVKCPNEVDLNVRLITVNRPDEARQSIHSEFFWQDGVFVSPLSSTAVTFDDAALGPVISDWQEFTVAQGSNLGPTNGSTITMAYNRIGTDNYTLRPSDTFKWLRTNVKYEQADIVTLLGAANTETPVGAQPEYTADFLMPSTTDEYLYLVWDYSESDEVYLLDDYPGAAAAYSVRKLSSTYSGSAMRVRRTVAPFDEQDIGFDSNGDLDTSAIISFGGADPLAVSVWYDQSGGSNDASQAASSIQPEIYDGTAVITEPALNGKPALDFTATRFMQSGNVITDENVSCIGVATAITQIQTVQALVSAQSGINVGYELIYVTPNMSWRCRSSDLDVAQSQDVQSLIFADYNGASQELAVNGSNSTKSSLQTFSVTDDLMIGSRNQGAAQQPWGGTMQEIIIYNTSQSTNRTGIESNLNTYFNIF